MSLASCFINAPLLLIRLIRPLPKRFADDNRMLMSAAFGQSGIKVRIVNVLNYKKLTFLGAAVSLLLLLVIAAVLITNPQLRG